MLANGEQLVTQVMPGNLLPQSVALMRHRFSSIAVKRIYTLKFGRSHDTFTGAAYVSYIHSLVEKLDRARRERAIVMTTPDAIKSVLLKYLDLLQGIQAADPRVFMPAVDLTAAENRQFAPQRTAYEHDAQAADALRELMQLWGDKHNG